MKASEAIAIIKSRHGELSTLGEIHNKIEASAKSGFHSQFFSGWKISKEDKEALEGDGYLVDTRYSQGFDVRWYESSEGYLDNLLMDNNEHAYLKISDEVIDNYRILQGFKK